MELLPARTRAVITGGASNIGRGIVLGFAAERARVAIVDIDGPQAERVRREALDAGAAEVVVHVADLTTDEGVAAAAAAVEDAFGGVDALVNSAGWSRGEFFADDTDRALWQRTVEVNLFTAIGMTQALLPGMREAGRGSIVFLSSDAARGEIRQAVYGSTKAGLIALARTVAKEHGRHGVRSNVVAPGLVLPEEGAVGERSLWAGGRDTVFDERQTESILRQLPLRRFTTAADVAAAVLFLSSETAARQITGQVLSVSGGYSMF